MTVSSDQYWGAIAAEEKYFFEFERELEFRQVKPVKIIGDLYLFAGEPVHLAWARCIWNKVEQHSIESIGSAQKLLKKIPGKAFFYSTGQHRRGSLILDGLRKFRDEPVDFLGKFERVYAFTLTDANTVLVCSDFSRPHPLGDIRFNENKEAPSRAYLKLWELFTETGKHPQKGERCIDLGASPGGWTWVACNLGARVVSVDRSPLEGGLMNHPEVEFRRGDAFSLTPEDVGTVDWLLSDVICYPEKLYEYLDQWITRKKARNFACTLKFQGKCDFKTVKKFEELGRVYHLNNNKHELTWVRLEE